MSSSVAASGEQNAQQNFNPSWMRHAFNRGSSGTVGVTPRSSINDDQEDYPIAPPILAKHRYDRDELIKLKPKESVPPTGLKSCPFFIEIAQQPIVDKPLSELEVRLQHNINSSKAMSSLTHAERAAVAAGSAFGNGYTSNVGQSPNTKTPSSDRGGWTPVKSSWSKQNTPERGRGGATSRGSHYSRGGRTPQSENGSSGINGSVPNTPDDSSLSSPFSKLCAIRRGGGTGSVGRGASASAVTFNSRAEALYSTGEQNDRSKIARSESDDEDEEGWSSVGKPRKHSSETSRPAWTRTESWAQRTAESARLRDSAPSSESQENVWKDRAEMLKSALQRPSSEKESSEKTTKSTEGSTNTAVDTNPVHSDLTTSTSSSSQIGTENSNPTTQAPPVSVWGNSLTHGIPNMYNLQLLQQQQQLAAQIAAQQALAAAAASKPPEQVQFYYLDPTETIRGPFSKEQMDAWYKAGYFSDESLRVKRGENGEYKTIGKLVEANGKMTPFDYPEEASEAQRIQIPAFGHTSTPSFPGMFGGGIWGAQNGVDSMGMGFLVQSSIEKQMAAERQRLVEEHNRRLKEEAEKLQQLQEDIIRQMAMQQQLSQQQLREQENAILRHKEELQRKEQEMKEHALEIQKKLENEKLQLEEKRRAIEAENTRKLAEEKRLKELEAERKREEERILNAKRENEARLRKAEEAADLERRRLAKEAESAAEKIRQLQKKAAEDAARKRKEEAEALAKDRLMAEELSKSSQRRSSEENVFLSDYSDSCDTVEKQKQFSPSGSDDAEGWTTVAKPVTKHTKVAPWAAAAKQPEKAQSEKTLREIQMEEERQMRANQEKLAKLRKEEQSQQSALQNAGTWGNASSRLQWNQSNSGGLFSNKSAPAAWSTPSQEQPKNVVKPLFDGPSLEAANKIAVAKKASVPKAPVKPTTSTKSSANVQKPITKSKEEVASEALSSWFAKRFKQLASGKDEIDTNMLFAFVMDLENPNEVEDIVMSYLDESKAVKEFVREFLKRRIEMRNGNRPADVDDLSSARTVSAAPSDVNAGSNTGGQGKKKKKNQKMVLDGNILGFRGAAASDRLNKGEIDAIPIAPVNPSRR